MPLYEKLEAEAKAALKAKDPVKLSVLRMVLAAVKMVELEKNAGPVEDGDVLQIIQRQIKQHKESIEQFGKGNRQDLVNKEAVELKILEGYMPRQLTEDEIKNVIKDAVSEAGPVTRSDIGKVMKIVMEKVRGKADGKVVNRLVAEILK